MARPDIARRFDQVLWGVAWLLAALTAAASLGPQTEPFLDVEGGDRVSHAMTYFVVAGAFLAAAVWRPGSTDRGSFARAVLVVLLVVMFGAGLELAQAPLDHRSAELGDAVANAVGASTGFAVWTTLRHVLARSGSS